MRCNIGKRLKTGIITCLCIIMLQVPLLLNAQEQTPITPFRLSGVSGFLGLGLEWEDDYRENIRTKEPVKSLDKSLFEELGLKFDGYIYHPRLLEFKADTKLIFKQESETSNMRFQQDLRDKYIDYGLSMQILKTHPLSLTLITNRSTQETNSSFFESQRLKTNRQRASLHYRNQLFPTDLSYETLRSKGEGQDPTDDKLYRAYLDIRNEGKFGTSNLRYENEDRFQAVGNLEMMTNLVNFSNIYHFGSKERHLLTSLYRWRDQTGSISYKDVSWGESIYLRHTDKFDTYYRYDYRDSRMEDQITKQHRYRAGLKHQLYKSLATGVKINGENARLNSGTKDTISAELLLNYRKRLPFGSLNMNYRTLLENTDENLSGDKSHVLRKEHVFGENPEGNEVILLEHDLVDETTITFEDEDGFEITDPGTGFPIEEGVHYRIETIGALTKIRLISPDGTFLQGNTVYVTYDFESTPPIEFETLTQTYGGRLNIKKIWKIFYYGGQSYQTLTGGTNLGRLENTSDQSFGTELVWKNSTTRAEKKVHRSTRNPYETTRYSEVLLFKFKKPPFFRPVLSLSGSYSETTTFEYIEKSTDRSVKAKLFLFLPYQSKCEIETQYRNQELVGVKQETLEFRTNLRWRYRALSMLLTYENLRRNQETTLGKEKRERIYLRARRFFGKRR